MITEFAAITIFALLVFAFIVVLALLLSPDLRARIGVGNADLIIEAHRPAGLPTVPAPSVSAQHLSPLPPPLHAWLAIKRRGKPDWTYRLDEHPIYIGRGTGNHIRLVNDPKSDQRHVVIYVEGNRYHVANLSPRGTWVNNRSIVKQVLGDGNTIQVGATRIIFREKRDKDL